FILGILRHIAETVERDEGAGSVPEAINASIRRLIAFEIQLGPFAVAQLRVTAELTDLIGSAPASPVRMFVTDTLSNPYETLEWIPNILAPIAESRRQADEIKKNERITVVIGNPPYKEKAKGRGGWVEKDTKNSPEPAPLKAWIPPPAWGVGVHTKHLRNLYVYFWRWATWKVFDRDPNANTGIVCFITVAGFLNGPGFQRMRDYLRRKCDEIWVIDCSPEGHQPDVHTRIFEAVQQPVCIVLASRPSATDPRKPATVRFRALPAGDRLHKFSSLASLTLSTEGWVECPKEWRSAFLPESTGEWSTYPSIDDLFQYNGSGVMPGRTWIIAPDTESLQRRWEALLDAPLARKADLFHPHLVGGLPGDRHIDRIIPKALPRYDPRPVAIASEAGPSNPPIRYAFRTLDRQWIIPDNRLINRPNPSLWEWRSDRQVYLTAPGAQPPTSGPSVSFTGLIPDMDHYNGRGGRVFPLWRDRKANQPNIVPSLLRYLEARYETVVSAEDLMAYIAAIAANPSFTDRFRQDLIKPGLRIPITADANLFAKARDIGARVIWLQTFGERFADQKNGRPVGPPRLPADRTPRIPAKGAIPRDPDSMPDTIDYNEGKRRLSVGGGYIENVSLEMWRYEVSGKPVLRHWFSYRKRRRDRPIIGDRRTPSELGNLQPDHWLAEYTTELINLLNVIGLLVDLEPVQAELLEEVCSAPTISRDELLKGGAMEPTRLPRSKRAKEPSADYQPGLLD
ncbi:MAG TPA: type ISP restriction/modification enzyme, partial [Blastocatellia bacterium]